MEKEKWKDIPGYEGRHQASNKGRVKSLSRLDSRGSVRKEKILSQWVTNTGYNAVKVGYGKQVHQLIAMAFLNHTPCGSKIVVDHIDNDPLNNNLNNLQLISQRENCTKDKRGGSSKYVGVYFCNTIGKYVSQIQIDGKRKTIGRFEDEVSASEAYQKALKAVLK